MFQLQWCMGALYWINTFCFVSIMYVLKACVILIKCSMFAIFFKNFNLNSICIITKMISMLLNIITIMWRKALCPQSPYPDPHWEQTNQSCRIFVNLPSKWYSMHTMLYWSRGMWLHYYHGFVKRVSSLFERKQTNRMNNCKIKKHHRRKADMTL